MNIPSKWTSLFLIAPAGWGKTSLIFDLYARNSWNILIVTPLKSLEQEIQRKILKSQMGDSFFRVLTSEKVPSFLEMLGPKEKENLLVVFDEIHLWNHWGDSFRQKMWESFYEVSGDGIPFLAITATLRDSYRETWSELLYFGGYKNKFLNLGNGECHSPPTRNISFNQFRRDVFFRRFRYEIEKGERCLIFCRFKQEVYQLTKELAADGVKVKSCVGGKTMEFLKECEIDGEPQVIVSTSVLSHGVNLGQIRKVFISYELTDWDIYLQMLSRGGRDGNGFQVFSTQKDSTSYWDYVCIWFFDRYLRLFYA